MLYSELVLCCSPVFSIYQFSGNSYVHFPFPHSVHYNFLFLCYSLAHSHSQGPVWLSGVKKLYFRKQKEIRTIKLDIWKAKYRPSCPLLRCFVLLIFSSYLSSVFSHLSFLEAPAATSNIRGNMLMSGNMSSFLWASFSARLHGALTHEIMSSYTEHECFNLCPKILKNYVHLWE